MQTDRRKELRDAYKSRRPDMGVVELRCTATGQRFLGITRDAAKELNSLRAKLNGGGHPNRPLQQLWSEHGENGFDFRVADTLEYENPEDVSADDLQALRDLLLAEDPEARKIWKWARRVRRPLMRPCAHFTRSRTDPRTSCRARCRGRGPALP